MAQQEKTEASLPNTAAPTAEEHEERRATRWLSRGFEELVFALANDPSRSETEADFDAVIVGSGYGGAVAARGLAACGGGKKICVLERGREYLPGSFPSRMADLAGHVRFTGAGRARPRGYREGLFDVRVGKDLSAIVANGVGGGSLINAGVMLLPVADVFQDASWPQQLRGAGAYDSLKKRAKDLMAPLGATQTIADSPDRTPHKFQAIESLGAGRAKPVPISVALADGLKTSAGIAMDKCIRCGDCATGCNYNAKVSLDITLLAEAKRDGAEIFSGATLLRIEKLPREDDSGKEISPLWKLHLVHTDEALRRRQGEPFVVRAAHVVLAAGTFGSTEILLRSRSERLRFSPRLGQQFSSNGDVIAAVYDTRKPIDGVGNEIRRPNHVPEADRVGPTITGCIDLRESDGSDGLVIQDLAVPGPLRHLMEEVVTTTAALHMLGEADRSLHRCCDDAAQEAAIVDRERMRKTLLVAMMSRDSADGVLRLARGSLQNEDEDEGDGAISVHWPTLRTQPAFARQHRKLERLVAASRLKAGRVLPNPVWKPLPQKLDHLLGGEAGPMFTVHPLGGCPMGDSPASGVVDDCGRVFDFNRNEPTVRNHHDGLAVLDGSIVPTSLGINPALAIATLADRAVEQLKAKWGFTEAPGKAASVLPPRPRFRMPEVNAHPRPTKIEITERLSGAVSMLGMERKVHVELTMQFDPIELRKVMTPGATMDLDASRGRIRIFADAPCADDEAKDEEALLVATLSGSLRVLQREPSTPLQRRLRGGWAWFRNRGLRDTVLWLIDSWTGQAPAPKHDTGLWGEVRHRVASAWNLASRAGAVRRLDYEWTIEEVLRPGNRWVVERWTGQRFSGSKRLTYSRRSNPWRQLSEVTLNDFPDMARWTARPVLELDTGYLARQGVPLLRIVDQQDQPSAMADLTSFALYLLRILLHVHVWSARLPDAPRPRDVSRLPGRVRGLPEPNVRQIEVAQLPDGDPVLVRLTQYPSGRTQRDQALRRRPEATEAIETPVLLIHGFSASGTTYAHPALRPSLAQALWDAGRDVWIVDLRTSAGMPHARFPWTFEEAAYADIPVAIEHVLKTTGQSRLDVFAHCIGSAMLGMSLLGRQQPNERFWQLREDLTARIRSLVISQVPPAMVLTPANVFRAHMMRYLKYYLPTGGWQFRQSAKPGVGEQMVDRLLATLPYPREEFDRENPLWRPWHRTPWVGTRHRMDALYGRDFSVNNLPQRVLDAIDDQFGPLNLSTVSQVIHFANFRSIANHRGFNEFLNPDQLRKRYDFPVLLLHGADNGVASIHTLSHFEAHWNDARMRHGLDKASYDGAGHQDCLIGVDASHVFARTVGFYESVGRLPAAHMVAAAMVTARGHGGVPAFEPVYACEVPAFGVRIRPSASPSELSVSVGNHGARGDPACGVFLPVAHENGSYRLFDSDGQSTVEPTLENFGKLARIANFETIDSTRERNRFQFNLARSALAAGADSVLVMLLYRKTPNGGELDPLGLKLKQGSPADGNESVPSPAGSSASDAAPPASVPVLGFLTRPGLPASDLIEVDAHEAVAIRDGFVAASPATLASGVLRLPPRQQDIAAPARASAGLASHEPHPPPPQPDARAFVLASCQYPGGLLDRTAPGVAQDAALGPADASWRRLEARLDDPSRAAPSFMVLAGDQVYIDATAGLFDPKRLSERFDRPYENFLGARGPRSVLGRLPAYMLLDDHEIDNDWEPDPQDARLRRNPASGRRRGPSNDQLKKRGIGAYLHYLRDADGNLPGADRLWQALSIDDIPFFLADGRTKRSARTAATIEQADLLGDEQVDALARWLDDTSSPGPRFLVTGSMVLPRTLAVRSGGVAAALRSDAWDGYPLALHRLLAQVYERGRNDIVFLSGDAHRGNVTTIELTREGSEKKVIAHSIHCPALYAPYPFANAIPEDFARSETFYWLGPPAYRCAVKSWFPAPGDGFALISVTPKHKGWHVEVEFDLDPREAARGETRYDFDIPVTPLRDST